MDGHVISVTMIESGHRGERESRRCLFCQGEFAMLKSKIGKNGRSGKYCSQKCAIAHRRVLSIIACVCSGCGKPFERIRSEIASERVYCSSDCRSSQDVERICLNCKNPFVIKQRAIDRGGGAGKYCSQKCRREKSKKEHSTAWKGGEFVTGGYVRSAAPDHPHAVRGYVLKARLIIEAQIGRYLRRDEMIGYRDKNRLNLDPSNLIVMTKARRKDISVRRRIVALRLQTIWDKKQKKRRPLYNKEIAAKVDKSVSFVSMVINEAGYSKFQKKLAHASEKQWAYMG